MSAAMALAALLGYAVLTIWVEERWAWSLFQAGIFALAAWRAVRPARFTARTGAGSAGGRRYLAVDPACPGRQRFARRNIQ